MGIETVMMLLGFVSLGIVICGIVKGSMWIAASGQLLAVGVLIANMICFC